MLDPSRRRTAAATYWNMRRCSPTISMFFDHHMKKHLDARASDEGILAAQVVDLEVAKAFKKGRIAEVNTELKTSDTLEHCMSTLAAMQSYNIHGDAEAYQAMRTAKNPEEADMAPSYEIERVQTVSKTLYLEAKRAKGAAASHAQYSDDDEEHGGAKRRARGNRGKNKAQGAVPKAPAPKGKAAAASK